MLWATPISHPELWLKHTNLLFTPQYYETLEHFCFFPLPIVQGRSVLKGGSRAPLHLYFLKKSTTVFLACAVVCIIRGSPHHTIFLFHTQMFYFKCIRMCTSLINRGPLLSRSSKIEHSANICALLDCLGWPISHLYQQKNLSLRPFFFADFEYSAAAMKTICLNLKTVYASADPELVFQAFLFGEKVSKSLYKKDKWL